MAEVNDAHLFNSPIEVGLRIVAILFEASPKALDLELLVMLDFAVLHSGDFPGGPESLHPPSPFRAGEVAIRRQIIERGLHLYASRGMVERRLSPSGFSYAIQDDACDLLDALDLPYVNRMRARARWAYASFGVLSRDQVARQFELVTGKWKTEFLDIFEDGEVDEV